MMWLFGGFGMIFMLLFWGGIVALVVWGVKALGGGQATRDSSSRALEILAERYARGDIDADEFSRRRSEIGGA